MANGKAITASFFENGTTAQFEYCFKLYPEVLKLKAEKRCKKPQELIRLDQWYQNELPKLIKARGKDAHLIYDELVQTMKWKQSRGKFYPQLSYLVKVNTPRAVMQETKKAFRKLPNLEQAITALSNLKGVGTTMASALLAAASPDSAPFMADECLMAIPEIEGIDYTTKEYLNFVNHIQTTVQRLNSEVGGETPVWSPHRVELALWSHYVANDLNPELLDDMPAPGAGGGANTNGSINSKSALDDEKALDGEDTNDGDDESLGAVGRNTLTGVESETDNENTNPASLAPVATHVTLTNKNNESGHISKDERQEGDGDSNFISNDSTSQEPNIDENTTQTTATTSSSTEDGEEPLVTDSESNIEAPVVQTAAVAAKQLNNNSNVQQEQTTTTTTDDDKAPELTELLPKKANNGHDLVANNAKAANAAAAVSVIGNGNGNGAILHGDDGENSNQNVDDDVDDSDAADEDSTDAAAIADESSNSNLEKLQPINNDVDAAAAAIADAADDVVGNRKRKTALNTEIDTDNSVEAVGDGTDGIQQNEPVQKKSRTE